MLFFAAIFVAMVWPVYPVFNRISPFVLGMPFSLFYQMLLVAAAFVGLLVFYRLDAGEDEPD